MDEGMNEERWLSGIVLPKTQEFCSSSPGLVRDDSGDHYTQGEKNTGDDESVLVLN